MQRTIKLFLVLMLSTMVNASSNMAPIVMDDIITFVPTVSVSTTASTYPVNATVTVNVNGTLSNNKDWVGIFKKGTPKKWGNQIAWNFLAGKHSVALTRNKKPMPAGAYDVALFFNNALDTVEASASFDVYNNPISNVQNTGVNQVVTVRVNKHSSNKDWVAIFKKGVEKKWGNQIAWSFVEGESSVTINPGNKLPAGEYEVALFLDNSLDKVEASVGFRVNGALAYEYGKMGDKTPIATPIVTHFHDANNDGTGVIYHPSDWDMNPTPVIFFARGWTDIFTKKEYGSYRDYDAFLKFIVSKGYSVIYFEYNENYDGQARTISRIIKENKDKFDTSRVGVVGHSSGGGNAFRVLKDMIDLGYGSSGKFLFAFDPYYAADMKKADIQGISDANIVIARIGKGNKTDARIVLTIYDLLNASNDKNYIVIPSNGVKPNHHYINKQSIDEMQLLLKPLDALMRYTLEEKDSKHHAVALEGKDKNDPYHGSQKVLEMNRYKYNCKQATDIVKKYFDSDINYCGEPFIKANVQ